jgi:hypothetical protein
MAAVLFKNKGKEGITYNLYFLSPLHKVIHPLLLEAQQDEFELHPMTFYHNISIFGNYP